MTDAPITPEQQSTMDGYAQKLNEMTGGASGKAATAAAKSAEPAAAKPETTENQKAIAKLNAPDSDLWSRDEAKQKAAYAKLRVHLAAEEPQETKDNFANLPIGQLRESAGVEVPKMPAQLEAAWNTEREAEVIVAFHERGVPNEFLRDTYEWYATRGIANGGAFTQEDAGEFRAFAAKKGLDPAFVEQLIQWEGGAAA